VLEAGPIVRLMVGQLEIVAAFEHS